MCIYRFDNYRSNSYPITFDIIVGLWCRTYTKFAAVGKSTGPNKHSFARHLRQCTCVCRLPRRNECNNGACGLRTVAKKWSSERFPRYPPRPRLRVQTLRVGTTPTSCRGRKPLCGTWNERKQRFVEQIHGQSEIRQTNTQPRGLKGRGDKTHPRVFPVFTAAALVAAIRALQVPHCTARKPISKALRNITNGSLSIFVLSVMAMGRESVKPIRVISSYFVWSRWRDFDRFKNTCICCILIITLKTRCSVRNDTLGFFSSDTHRR